jgi:N-acetylglucosaminyl-diphospho-decaprenol L-rhamnosyltransferase
MTTSTVDVSVLVVSYETRDLTLQCLESLLASTTALRLQVVVVDNASRDGTATAVTTQLPTVEVVALEQNIGFARAVNLAADRAEGRHLLLLNPDTIVPPGAIDALVAFAEAHPEHGIVGGRTLRADGSLDPSSCWGAPTPWSVLCFATGASTVFRGSRIFDPESLGRWPRDSERPVDVVTGCLLLLDRDLWRRLDGFDPRYFMYGEDVDLCLRAGRLGFRPAITPAATITHLVGASSATSGAKRQLVLTGKATLLRKHWGPVGGSLGVGLLLVGVALRAGVAAVRGRPDQWTHTWRRRRAWARGYVDPSPIVPDPLPRSVPS